MKRVVVLGGGFAGLNAALAARRVLRFGPEIMLISREPWLTMRPRLYEAGPEDLKIDLKKTLQKVHIEFRAGDAFDFDTTTNNILLRDQPAVQFDRLVLATGSVMERPKVVGSHLPFSIDDRNSAILFDKRLQEISADKPPTIVVVGAGFTGIELILEMRDRLAMHVGQVAEKARLILVDRQSRPGEELGETVRHTIQEALSCAGIELRMKSAISRLSSHSVCFADGSFIDADAVVLCTGLVASPLTRKLPAQKCDRGRLIADEFLRLREFPAIFAAGDVVLAQASPGRSTLFSCQHSLQLGKFAGANAALDLLGQPMNPYHQEPYVTCLDLGRSGAVFTHGWNREIRVIGHEAKAIKRRINTELIYPPQGSPEEILAASQTHGKQAPIVP